VRLTAIFDSCHSGSALDLPYIYSTQGLLKEPNLAKEAGQGLLGIVSSYARGDIGGMASSALGLFKKAVSGDDVYQKNLRTKTSPADVVMWSGSKDSQTSYVDSSFPFFDPTSAFLCPPKSSLPISAASGSLFEAADVFAQQQLSVDFLPVSTVNMGVSDMGLFPIPEAGSLMPVMASGPVPVPTVKQELDSAIGLSPLTMYPPPWMPLVDARLTTPGAHKSF
jgi:hypothetical protein